MTDKKITELTALTTPAAEDLLVIVDDVAGSPTTKKITVANLIGNHVNLLSNSGFGVWSNSTLENVRALPDATSVATGTSIASTAHLLAAGMLVKDAAGTPLVFEVVSITSADTFVVDRTGWTDGQAYEVTPGCVAADILGPDGWVKDTSMDLYRQHNDPSHILTKEGSFYSLKCVPASQWDFVSTPYVDGAVGATEWIEKFRGRTVTFGAWVWASTAAAVQLTIDDGAWVAIKTHSGNSSWEWLETTHTIEDDATILTFSFNYINASVSTFYISQPMLVFGSSIGEGKYQPRPGEIVNVEANIALTNYTASAVSADATVNLEAQSRGKIPKGCKVVHGWIEGQNSAADKFIDILSASGRVRGARLYSQVAGKDNSVPFRAVCNSSGDIYLDVEDGNWTNVTIQVNAVEI